MWQFLHTLGRGNERLEKVVIHQFSHEIDESKIGAPEPNSGAP